MKEVTENLSDNRSGDHEMRLKRTPKMKWKADDKIDNNSLKKKRKKVPNQIKTI